MTTKATDTMIATPIKTNEMLELFVVGVEVGGGVIICAVLDVSKKLAKSNKMAKDIRTRK